MDSFLILNLDSILNIQISNYKIVVLLSFSFVITINKITCCKTMTGWCSTPQPIAHLLVIQAILAAHLLIMISTSQMNIDITKP